MTNEKKKTCDVEGMLNEQQSSCVTSHVAGLRAVEFYFHFKPYKGEKNILRGLPYAVNWNGLKQPSEKVAIMGRDAAIRVLARPGHQVSVYLGNDASPEFRQVPIYTVEVGLNDIRVDIHDEFGLHDHTDVPTLVQQGVPTGHGDKVDKYKAFLTGDIWMKFSHKYTVAEALKYLADAGLAGDIEIERVLKGVYGGQVDKKAYRTLLGGRDCVLSFQAGADSVAAANIKSGYHFARECQPRVHPNTWIGTLQAARNAQVSELELASGWRPFIGSKAHRMGLGFDIKYFQLQGGKTQTFDTRAPQQLYASTAEKEAHQALVAAAKARLEADKALTAAHDSLTKAKGEEGKRLAEDRAKTANDAAEKAKEVEGEKRSVFDKIHQTTAMWSFERELLLSPLIKQVLDPFYVDHNTQDNKPGSISMKPNSNTGEGHQDHLHITAFERNLLP